MPSTVARQRNRKALTGDRGIEKASSTSNKSNRLSILLSILALTTLLLLAFQSYRIFIKPKLQISTSKPDGLGISLNPIFSNSENDRSHLSGDMKSALDGLDMDDLQHMMNLLYGRDDGTDFDEEGKDENGGKAQVGVETIEDERKKRFENLAGVLKDSVKEKGGKVEL